jgi:hypothetical protein
LDGSGATLSIVDVGAASGVVAGDAKAVDDGEDVDEEERSLKASRSLPMGTF